MSWKSLFARKPDIREYQIVSSLQRHDKIDLAALDKTEDRVVLALIETREWSAAIGNIHDLQEKLNYYIAYAEQERLVADFPKATGKKIEFRLQTKYTPDQAAMDFIESVRKEVLATRNITLTIQMLPS
jgi:hypothetical protein